MINYQLISTYRVESIKHIFRIFPQTQLFEALKNQGVII